MRTTRRPQRTVRSDHWSGQAATRAGCRRVLSVTDIARALFCAGLLGTTVFLGAARAEAAPVSFSLTWDAPPACPDAAYLRAQVETLLAGAPSLLARVVARAEVSQRDDGMWTVRLTTDRDGTLGERFLEADACRSLADATALVVALTIDPAHVIAAGAAGTEPEASLPPSKPQSPPASAQPSRPDPRLPSMPAPISALPQVEPSTPSGTPRPPARFAIAPAIAGDLGTLPNPEEVWGSPSTWARRCPCFGIALLSAYRAQHFSRQHPLRFGDWPRRQPQPKLGASGLGAQPQLSCHARWKNPGMDMGFRAHRDSRDHGWSR
jgi:hypothetical protein